MRRLPDACSATRAWPECFATFAELWRCHAVTDKGFGNYRIPLLFIAMLVPLVFQGGGKLSLDHLLSVSLGSRRH